MPFFGGPLQQLIGQQPGQQAGQGLMPQPGPNPYMNPQTPLPIQIPQPEVPGMPATGSNRMPTNIMPQISPAVLQALGGGQGGQPQQGMTPLQRIIALLGSFGIGSLLAGGNRHGTPLVGPSAGMNMWH